MDSERFDRLSRQLANGISRRGVLKGLFGGAAAVATGGLGRRSVMAHDDVGCVAVGQDCSDLHPCCAGTTCTGGVCVAPTTCVAAGEACNDLHPCCPGTECTGGVCVAHPTCAASGEACNDLHPCCSGTACSGGVCAPPPPAFCGHSVGLNGGCKGACTSAGFTGQQCNPICGNGQFVGLCPVGQGGDNPCCNTGLCNPANFRLVNGAVTYVGPSC